MLSHPAGFLTHLIGFPIRLVATVNVNDFLSRSLQGGNASAADQVTVTLAPSMDIQVLRPSITDD